MIKNNEQFMTNEKKKPLLSDKVKVYLAMGVLAIAEFTIPIIYDVFHKK